MGLLSKMGGKIFYYHSDKLAEMMLDDLLGDLVLEMSNIE
jgi:hypothetical protein